MSRVLDRLGELYAIGATRLGNSPEEDAAPRLATPRRRQGRREVVGDGARKTLDSHRGAAGRARGVGGGGGGGGRARAGAGGGAGGRRAGSPACRPRRGGGAFPRPVPALGRAGRAGRGDGGPTVEPHRAGGVRGCAARRAPG